MIQEWLELNKILGVAGLPRTVQGITKKAKLEHWQRRRKQGVKGKVFEYYVGDMPIAVQQALGFSKHLTKETDKPISQDDFQKRINQLENKLQALENKTLNLENKAQEFLLNPIDSLTEEEWMLVCAFRRCNGDRQVGLLATAEALAAKTEKEQKESLELFKDRQVA